MLARSLAFLSGILTLAAGSAVDCASAFDPDAKLPIFFFHGVTGNRGNADNFVANLTAEGRVVVPLSFCEDDCSFSNPIRTQAFMAIDQVRGIVTGNSTFDNGYIFVAHS